MSYTILKDGLLKSNTQLKTIHFGLIIHGGDTLWDLNWVYLLLKSMHHLLKFAEIFFWKMEGSLKVDFLHYLRTAVCHSSISTLQEEHSLLSFTVVVY